MTVANRRRDIVVGVIGYIVIVVSIILCIVG